MPFDKIDFLEDTRHLALNRGHIQGLNGSNAREHDWLVVLLHLRGDNRDELCDHRRRRFISEPPMDDGERYGGQGDNAKGRFVGHMHSGALWPPVAARSAERRCPRAGRFKISAFSSLGAPQVLTPS
jgi:hypothetical protein